jgi:ketosteroid isomerase-like protein
MTATSAVTSQTMDVSGDLGFDNGTFTGTMTPTAGGDAMSREGRYIVILRRAADGAWRISRSISNAPMPTDAMMPGGGL